VAEYLFASLGADQQIEGTVDDGAFGPKSRQLPRFANQLVIKFDICACHALIIHHFGKIRCIRKKLLAKPLNNCDFVIARQG
jgi:hypothetical protein